MPTTVTKSVGSAGGRDYSSVNGWVAGSPASLVTADEVWRGEFYNDSEFTATWTISGITTDATRYVEMTAAAGQSFQDNANVRTNALYYNQSNGVGLRRLSGGYGDWSSVTVDNFHLSRLQFSSPGVVQTLNFGGNANLFKDLIVVYEDSAHARGCLNNGYCTAINLLMISYSGSGISAGGYGAAPSAYIACTAVCPSNLKPSGGNAYNGSHGNPCTTVSCASFGHTNFSSLGTSTGSQNNASDLGSIDGTSGQTSVTYNATTPFTQASSASALDFRPIASTALAANGFLDSTNAPNDITGTARSGTPTIGVWELASSGPAFIAALPLAIRQAVKRASLY